jgi:hypothetical protein
MLFGLTFGHFFSMTNMLYRVLAYDDCAVTILRQSGRPRPTIPRALEEARRPQPGDDKAPVR